MLLFHGSGSTALSILQWVRTAEWIKIAVTIATAVVAVFSILIERKLVAQEKERAAVSRSIALYRDFVESSTVDHLLEVHHTIDRDLWAKYGPDITEEEIRIGSISIYGEMDTIDREEILQSVAQLLQNIKIIYDCGNYQNEYEMNKNEEAENLCDQKTISILIGGIMTELFFSIRPVLYCDDFIKNSYLGKDKDPSTYIGMFESLILDHLKENHGEDRIFRTKVDWVNSGRIPAKDYIIVRLPDIEDRCKYYNPS